GATSARRWAAGRGGRRCPGSPRAADARRGALSQGAQGPGHPIYSVREGGELSDLVANIVAAVAEDEIQREGERVASIFRHTKERGWHIPGSIPWGYRPRPATPAERAESAQRSVIEVDPLAAPSVVEMFRRAAAGEGINSLQHWVATLSTEVR